MSGLAGAKQGVWLRQLESGYNVQIIPPSDDTYFGLANLARRQVSVFHLPAEGPRCPGRHLPRFDLRRDPGQGYQRHTGQHKCLGATAKRSRSAANRDRVDDYCTLWIADTADGKNENKARVRVSRPIRIGDSRISPDGRLVAFAAGRGKCRQRFRPVGGRHRERDPTLADYTEILQYQPLSSGCPTKRVYSSRPRTIPNRIFGIWYVSAATGEVQRLTKNSESYSALSLDKASNVSVSTRVEEDFHLKLFDAKDPAAPSRVLADGTGVTFVPNGKIIFSSLMTGNDEIWSINADGSGKLQLTDDPADDRFPVVSSDGELDFFASNRTGEVHVWRMNATAATKCRPPEREGGWPLFVSPDGRWIDTIMGCKSALRVLPPQASRRNW